jgi:hypothetical protein
MSFRRYLPFIFLLLLISLPATAFAQSGPTVAIEMAAMQAVPGDTVTANVMIRNGKNIAGADVGIETDECLRIVQRTQGSFLPDPANGGFTVFDETTEHTSRLAVAITDRAKIANADGVFFQVDMEVLCSAGAGEATVSFAELSAYRDPAAEQIELVAYTFADDTLAGTNAQLVIDATAIGSDQPAQTVVESGITEAVQGETAPTQAPTSDESADFNVSELATVAQQSAESNSFVLLAALLIVTAVIASVGTLLIYRAFAGKR